MEQQRKRKAELAEIRGLFLGASALANWGRLTDDEKRQTSDRISRLILRTEPRREEPNEIICRKCKEQKPIDAFRPSIIYKSGRETWCNKCRNEYMREWQRRKRENR